MVNGRAAIRQACRTDLSVYGVEGIFDILDLELENWTDPNGPFGSQARNVIQRVRFNDEMGYVERFLRSGGMGRGAAIELITFETAQPLIGESSSLRMTQRFREPYQC